MAKKKAESSAAKVKAASAAKATKPRTKKPATANTGAVAAQPSKKRTAKAAPEPINISNELIGHAAGEVWRALAEGGVLTLSALKQAADVPDELVVSAVGWLAREDKLTFDFEGGDVSISLR